MIVLSVVSCLLLVSLLKLMPAVVVVHKEVENLSAQLSQHEKAAADASEREAYYESDKYLERETRLKLNYKKPEEKVVFIYKNQYNQDAEKKEETLSWWEKMKRWLRD